MEPFLGRARVHASHAMIQWNNERESMEPHMPTCEGAHALLREFGANESLVKHALAVAAAMRFMAIKRHEEKKCK